MKRFRLGLQPNLLVGVVLALATAVFFYPVFRGEVLFFGDNLSLKLPNAIYAAVRLREGVLPLWNPYLFAGIPFLADISTAVFYPFSLFFLVLDPFWALTVVTIMSVFLAGVSFFLFVKELGMSRIAAFSSAMTFMFSATILHYTSYLPLLSSSIWLPFTFLAFYKAIARGSTLWSVVAAFSLALQIFGGHPQPVLYTLVLLFSYWLFFSKVRSWNRLKPVLLLFGLAFGVTAVVVLPALELARLSTRSSMDFVTATGDSLHPVLLLRLFLPNLFDQPQVGMTWGPAWRHVADNTGYLGILTFVILFLSAKRIFLRRETPKRRLFLFFLGAACTSLILALGRYTPIYQILFTLIPFFRVFRGPAEALLPFSLSMAVCGGIAFDEVKKRGLSFVAARRLLIMAGFMWAVGIVFFLVGRFGFGLFWRPFSTFHTFERDQVIVGTVSANMVLASLLFGLSIIVLFRKKYWFFVGLVFLDLLFFNSRYVFTMPRQLVRIESEPGRQLQNVLAPSERFLSYQDSVPFSGLGNYWENMAIGPPFAATFYTPEERRSYRELNRRLSDLALNWNMVYGLPTPHGYASFVLSAYAKYLRGDKISSLRLNEVGLQEVEAEKLNQLSVAYFLSEQGIVRSSQLLPRSRVVDHSGESAGEAEILVNQPERVVVAVEADRQGVLVLADSVYPGWEVFVDGQRVEMGKYQGTFRSVPVLSGVHAVEYVFRPRLVYLGALISGFTIVICLLLVWKEKRIRSRVSQFYADRG